MKEKTKTEKIIEYLKSQYPKWRDSMEIAENLGIKSTSVSMLIQNMRLYEKHKKNVKHLEIRLNRNNARKEFRLKSLKSNR